MDGIIVWKEGVVRHGMDAWHTCVNWTTFRYGPVNPGL